MQRITLIRLDPNDMPGDYPEGYLDDKLFIKPVPRGTSPIKTEVIRQIKEALASPIPTPGKGWWYVGPALLPSPNDPENKTSLFGYRHTARTPDFKERCAKGEILMNNYAVCRGILSYESANRSKLISSNRDGYYRVPDYNLFFPVMGYKDYKEPVYSSYRWNKTAFINFDGPWRHIGANNFVPWAIGKWRTVRDVGLPPDPRADLDRLAKSLQSLARPVEHVTVQEVLAKANAGDLDVLTSMAEMPALVESILDGFRLIKKMFVDVRQKEIRAYATVPTRERRLATEAFNKKKLRALKKIPSFDRWSRWRENRGKSRRDYEAMVSERVTKIGDIRRFIKESNGVYRARALREVSEAMASVYLNMQYNIKPTIGMILDTLKAIDQFGSEYRRWGNGNTPVITEHDLKLPGIPEAQFVGVARTEFRCLIKRRYKYDGVMSKINQAFTADILVTGFELVRLWSIVFDWFFTISDSLRAIPWNRHYSEQKACLSWRTSVNGKFTWDHDGAQHSLEVEMERFHRELYNPVHSIGIYFRDNFGLMQQLAALAFSFQQFNGSIKKRYSYS